MHDVLSPDSPNAVTTAAQIQDPTCLDTTEFTDSVSASPNDGSNSIDHAPTPCSQDDSSAPMLAERRSKHSFWGATKINIPLSTPRRNSGRTLRSADASVAKVPQVQPHDPFTESSYAVTAESTQDAEEHVLPKLVPESTLSHTFFAPRGQPDAHSTTRSRASSPCRESSSGSRDAENQALLDEHELHMAQFCVTIRDHGQVPNLDTFPEDQAQRILALSYTLPGLSNATNGPGTIRDHPTSIKWSDADGGEIAEEPVLPQKCIPLLRCGYRLVCKSKSDVFGQEAKTA